MSDLESRNTPSQISTNIPYYDLQNEIDGDIDLGKIFFLIWKDKWWICIITILFAIITICITINLPNIYKSSVLLAPAQDSNTNKTALLMNQLGGLASLAGIGSNSSGVNEETIAIETLTSQRFLKKFIARHQLLVPLMASSSWEMKNNSLNIDSKIYDSKNKIWVRDVTPPFNKKPSLQEAYRFFIKNNLVVDQDKDTGLLTVSVEFYSPYLAKQWVSWLIDDLNEEIREQDMSDAELSMKYLEKQLNKTSLAENRGMLYQLIEQETKTLMLTKVKEEYAFKVVDPAVVPELKDKPKRALLCALGTIIGMMFSIFFVFIKNLIKSKRG